MSDDPKKPKQNETCSLRIRIDMSVGFDHFFDKIPLTAADIEDVTREIGAVLAKKNIGVVQVNAGGSTKLTLDMRHRELPAEEETVPVSRMRRTR